MSACLIRNARLYRSATRTFSEGELLLRDGRIVAVSEGESLSVPGEWTDCTVFDAEGRTVVPGLVDVHTHGRAGGDFGSAEGEQLTRTLASYLSSGVTTVLPTLASAPLDELHGAIDRINAAAEAAESDPSLPYVAGIHLEGRYLNPAKRGAHAPGLLAPLDADELEALLSRIKGARHLSAALELEGGDAFLDRALSLGATVGLGHSAADFATANHYIGRGVTAMTHLFNAMLPLHHRDGGAVAAGLLSPTAYCELIVDGVHIAPEMVKLAYTLARERLVLITDSMEATDCPDGEYSIAGMPVTVKEGRAVTHDGAIAGSTLSLLQAVLNLRDFAGISLEDALYAATMAPALEIGLDGEIGSLEVGKRADLLVMSDRFALDRVMCGGVWIR